MQVKHFIYWCLPLTVTKIADHPETEDRYPFFFSSFIGKPPCELFPAVYPKGEPPNRERFGRVSQLRTTPQIKPRG